jgi:hypothetical protein
VEELLALDAGFPSSPARQAPNEVLMFNARPSTSAGALPEAGASQRLGRSPPPRQANRSGSGALQPPKRKQPTLQTSRSTGAETTPALMWPLAGPGTASSSAPSSATVPPAQRRRPELRADVGRSASPAAEAIDRRNRPPPGASRKVSPPASHVGRNYSPELPRHLRLAGAEASTRSRTGSPETTWRHNRQTSKDAQREVPTPARSQAAVNAYNASSSAAPRRGARRPASPSSSSGARENAAPVSPKPKGNPGQRERSQLGSAGDSCSSQLPSSGVIAGGDLGPAHFEMYSPPRDTAAHPTSSWASPSKPAWMDATNPIGSFKAPSLPLVQQMSPTAPDTLDSLGVAPGAPDEASALLAPPYSARAPSGSRSPRAGSAHRRLTTPREYEVEIISAERARELAADVSLSDLGSEKAAPESPKCLQSPALLLCHDGGDSREDSLTMARSTSSVSISSDEVEIRDRLKHSLQLRGICVDEPPMSPPPTARRVPGSASAGGRTQRGPPTSSPGRNRRTGAASSSPRRVGGPQSSARDYPGARMATSSSPPPTYRGYGNPHASIHAASSALSGASALRPGLNSQARRVGVSSAAAARGVATSTRYAPVLSRRSLAGR